MIFQLINLLSLMRNDFFLSIFSYISLKQQSKHNKVIFRISQSNQSWFGLIVSSRFHASQDASQYHLHSKNFLMKWKCFGWGSLYEEHLSIIAVSQKLSSLRKNDLIYYKIVSPSQQTLKISTISCFMALKELRVHPFGD